MITTKISSLAWKIPWTEEPGGLPSTGLHKVGHYSSDLAAAAAAAPAWAIACQVSKSMEFSRQEYWSGLPFPTPGDLPHIGVKARFPVLQAILYH